MLFNSNNKTGVWVVVMSLIIHKKRKKQLTTIMSRCIGLLSLSDAAEGL